MKIEIEINGEKKEFESGNLNRKKYKKYTEVFNELENKSTYTEEDLDKIVDVLVFVWNNQFTKEDVDNTMDVADIIWYFSCINVNIVTNVTKKATDYAENFTKKR